MGEDRYLHSGIVSWARMLASARETEDAEFGARNVPIPPSDSHGNSEGMGASADRSLGTEFGAEANRLGALAIAKSIASDTNNGSFGLLGQADGLIHATCLSQGSRVRSNATLQVLA